jgi:hypothetical protein
MSTPPFPRARTCMHAEFDATPVNALTHTVTHMHTGNAPSAGRKTPHTGRLKEKLSDCHICRTPSLAGVKPNERSIALKLAANSACVQVRRCTFAPPPPTHTHTVSNELRVGHMAPPAGCAHTAGPPRATDGGGDR